MSELIDILTPSGDYTDQTATRDECHRQGYPHRGVVVFIIHPDHQKVLLQQRSVKKRLWPNLWDITAGGHVDTGEFGFEAAIREAKEEIGLQLTPNDLICIGSNTSENFFPNMTDRHFNEYFIVERDLDPAKLTLDPTEVQALRWFTLNEIKNHIDQKSGQLVPKTGCWERILRYLDTHPQAQST